MSILSQTTLAKKVSLSGIGIHTGKHVNVCILPSAPNTGIIFKRTDLRENNVIVPNFEKLNFAIFEKLSKY